MPPSSGDSGSQAKFPSTSDFNQVFNRINLSLSKHNTFLQNIRARHPPPPPPPPPIQTPPAAQSASPSTGAGFSSLAGKKPSSSAPGTGTGIATLHRKTRSDLDAEEAQFAEHSADVAAAALGSNAGIGYVPERKTVERAAEDRDLRGRLLGKRAREQREEAAAAAANKKRQRRRGGGGGAGSSDEEEEVGRSGLGRSKKKTKPVLATGNAESTQPDGSDNAAILQIDRTGSTEDGTGTKFRRMSSDMPDGPSNGESAEMGATMVEHSNDHKSKEGSKKTRKKKKKKSKRTDNDEA